MTVTTFLVAITCLAVSVAGFAYETESVDCDFTGIDVDAAISRMLSKIPKYEERISETYRMSFAGIKFFGVNTTGMNKLSLYGPAIPYCINGTRMIQVDLVNDGDVVVSWPWKTCEGREGTIDLKADVSRFTTQLRVTATGFNDVSFSHDGPVLPVTAENIVLKINGAGLAPTVVTEYLSMVFPAVLRAIWNYQFFYFADISLDKAVA
ncbi:uncharacterized protein LOC125946791 [Dermacentor silvarum]|uniref:uncharacterized protein LOC125946791 n=1 Tax=Dermacentor silvarum TaxID=543639 RepID=UPI002101388F|nr:uncharacterized protein LOC125946791 [Dermacentor silvarum]